MGDGFEEFEQGLGRELKRVYGGNVRVPKEVDDAILNRARAGMARRRRWSLALVWTVPAAAAAVVLVSLWVLRSPAEHRAQAAALQADLNGDGKVDILDAFYLARQIKEGRPLKKEWDINGDGVVDQKDVDAIAAQAVSLGTGVAR